MSLNLSSERSSRWIPTPDGKHQLKAIQAEPKHLQHGSVPHLPQPPPAPKMKHLVANLTLTPPQKPSLPKTKRARGTSLHPAEITSRDRQTNSICKLQTADNKDQKELQPLSNPRIVCLWVLVIWAQKTGTILTQHNHCKDLLPANNAK